MKKKTKSSKQSWWSKLPFMTKLSIFGLAILGIALVVSIPYLSDSDSVGDTRSRAAGGEEVDFSKCIQAEEAATCPSGYKKFSRPSGDSSCGTASCATHMCCPIKSGDGQGGGDGASAPNPGGSGGDACPGGRGTIDRLTGTVTCQGGGSGDGGGGQGGGGGGGESIIDRVLPKLKKDEDIQAFCDAGDAIVEEFGGTEDFKTHLKERDDELGNAWKILKYRNSKTLVKWYEDKFCTPE